MGLSTPQTVRKAAQKWEQAFTEMIPKEADAVGWVEAPAAVRLAGPKAQRHAAACLALEDSLTHDQPIVVLTDCKGFVTVASNWVGEGKDLLLRHSPDGDILARIIKLLHQRVSLGLFTMFIKIRAHRGRQMGRRRTRGCRQRAMGWPQPTSYLLVD